jgi:hypothetical protein
MQGQSNNDVGLVELHVLCSTTITRIVDKIGLPESGKIYLCDVGEPIRTLKTVTMKWQCGKYSSISNPPFSILDSHHSSAWSNTRC